MGLTKDMLAPGSTIILRANPSRRGPAGTLRGLDVTTSDGAIHPLVLGGRNSAPPVAEQATDSLAGRWASSPAALRIVAREMAAWPATEAARTAMEKVRAGAIESQAGCPRYPPPMLDDLPSVREITIGEKEILIRFDTGGVEAVRTIHLDRADHPADAEPSLLGHSIGRWDGETLVVDSVAFTPNARGISAIGIPSGPSKHMTERFMLAEDGLSLRRETTLEDPDYLTRPGVVRHGLGPPARSRFFERVRDLRSGNRQSLPRRPVNVLYGAAAGTIVAGNGQLPLSYGGQFGTASSGGG